MRFRPRFALCWLALLTVGCFHSSVVSKPSDLVGRWTLPASEGFVDFAETGSMALVSDSTGAVGYFKVQPGSKVEVESATNAGLQTWDVALDKGALQITFPGRPPVRCERAAEKSALKGNPLLGRWDSTTRQNCWLEFSPSGTYVAVLPVSYQKKDAKKTGYLIEEAGDYELEPGTLKLRGFRQKNVDDNKADHDLPYTLSKDSLEITWRSWSGEKRKVFRRARK